MTEIGINHARIGDVSGKAAIVTGGASGIGQAIVKLLAEQGANVVFCDLNADAGESMASALGSTVSFVKANILRWEELRVVFSHAKQQHGRIDLVFANAGAVQPQGIWEDEFDENGELAEPSLFTIDTCLKAHIWTAKLAMSYFKQNEPPGGGIVFTGSTSSYNERPNLPLYSTAKYGLLGLMRALRVTAPGQNVNVGLIAPGLTETPLVQSALEAAKAAGNVPQSADFVALGAVILANNKEYNGQGWVILGGKCSDVEGPLRELMPQWYGEFNTAQGNIGTGLKFGKP